MNFALSIQNFFLLPINLELIRYHKYIGGVGRIHHISTGNATKNLFDVADEQVTLVDEPGFFPFKEKYVFVKEIIITKNDLWKERLAALKSFVVNVRDEMVIKKKSRTYLTSYGTWSKGLAVIRSSDKSGYTIAIYLKIPETESPITHERNLLRNLLAERS